MHSYRIWHIVTRRSNFSHRRYHSLPTTTQTRIKTIRIHSEIPYHSAFLYLCVCIVYASFLSLWSIKCRHSFHFVMRHSKLFKNFTNIMVEYNGHLADTYTSRLRKSFIYLVRARETSKCDCMQFSFLSRIQQNGPLNKMLQIIK